MNPESYVGSLCTGGSDCHLGLIVTCAVRIIYSVHIDSVTNHNSVMRCVTPRTLPEQSSPQATPRTKRAKFDFATTSIDNIEQHLRGYVSVQAKISTISIQYICRTSVIQHEMAPPREHPKNRRIVK